MRGYCWRIGHAIEITIPCGECGDKRGHELLENQAECGAFAPCSASLAKDYSGREHGHGCDLAVGHEGTHECKEAFLACMTEYLAIKDSVRRLGPPDE